MPKTIKNYYPKVKTKFIIAKKLEENLKEIFVTTRINCKYSSKDLTDKNNNIFLPSDQI